MALGVGKNVASAKKNHLSACGIWQHDYPLIKPHCPSVTDTLWPFAKGQAEDFLFT